MLDDLQWQSRVFTERWQPSAGGDAAVVEPATGNELRPGWAADLTASAAQAAVAQREWAATPFPERAAVLRRAADSLQRHTDELRNWIVRETGGIPGKAYFELGHAVQNRYEAAALPSRSQGELLPSAAPRLSMVRRVPAGVVGVIAPFNGPLALAVRSVAPAPALGNAVLLKPDPRRLAAGGTYRDLFYRPTVLADAGPSIPAYQQEVFGPVASVTPFATLDDAVKLASDSEYGLSLGILTTNVARGLALAERIHTGIARINDQTINDEAHAPFGGVSASGTGSRFGGAAANIEAFTETRWITARGDIAPYPF